jgi:hypothetical protein
MTQNSWQTKSNILLMYSIRMRARDISLRKARTNVFNAECSGDFLVKSSLEAHDLKVFAEGSINVIKKLGVPKYGSLETKRGSIHIGSIYGPKSPIGDILDSYEEIKKELISNAVNIISHSNAQIDIGSSHGLLFVRGLNCHINLKDISNTACYVRSFIKSRQREDQYSP